MPNRIIRSDMLDSDRYWACTIEARELFTHMLLLADDCGCISTAPAFLGRHAFLDRPTPAKLAKLLGELVDQDLIRLYSDSLAFIPRFGQRLQRTTLKHRAPPPELYSDDDHAVRLFNKINGITEIPTVPQPGSTVPQPPEVEVEVEVEVEEKKKTPLSGKPDARSSLREDAKQILDYLNGITGRKFRPVDANLVPIMARLRSKATVVDCYDVINDKWEQWKSDERMAEFVRPKTLFSATNFEQYFGNLPEEQS